MYANTEMARSSSRLRYTTLCHPPDCHHERWCWEKPDIVPLRKRLANGTGPFYHAPISRSIQRLEAAEEIRFSDHPDERGAINDGQAANTFGDDHLSRCC